MRPILRALMGASTVVLLTAATAPALEDDAPAPRPRPEAGQAPRMAEALREHGETSQPPRALQVALVDKDGDPPFTILPLVYALVATAGVCVLGFKNSKRTHLD